MTAELTFAYILELADAEVLLAEVEGIEDQSVSVSRLATGSHVAVFEIAHIGFRNEADLLRHENLVWLERGTDLHAEAEASARRHLDAFLTELRDAELTHSSLDDEWPQHAQVRVDPAIALRLRQRPGPAPEYLRSLVGDAVRQLRKERGLSQKRLADAAGLHTKNVAAVERRRGPLNMTHLGCVAAALEVPVSEVFQRAEQTPRQATLNLD